MSANPPPLHVSVTSQFEKEVAAVVQPVLLAVLITVKPETHPVVVAPPFASVQSVAAVPVTVPAASNFVSVAPWMAV